MKVYLAYPWLFPDSPYYKYLVGYPPETVEYVNAGKGGFKVISSKRGFYLNNRIKRFLRGTAEALKVPNIAFNVPSKDVDLIHCAHCVVGSSVPWVVDVEAYWNFTPSGKIAHSERGKRWILKYLEKDSCRKILPWTQAAKADISRSLGNRTVEEKMEVVYPAVPMPATVKKQREKEHLNLLFIGRYFYQKGGLVVAEAFNQLIEKYDVKATMVTEAPEEIKRRYPEIRFLPLMPQDRLFSEVYPDADIFVYPGYSDSFGFAMLEALSFGLPVITVDGYSKREVVEDGRTGFVLERPVDLNPRVPGKWSELLSEELVEKTSLLIEDSSLRDELGRHGKQEIEKGKFSIEQRNKKLKSIYEEALL